MMQSNGGTIATDDDWGLYPIANDSERKRLTSSQNGMLGVDRPAA